MARKNDKDIDVIPNALGLMYFDEKTNSKITIDGDNFKKGILFVSAVLYIAFSLYLSLL